MAKLVKPFKIHGGKHYLAPKIVGMMPKHIHYVEPYAGGLSVLLAHSGEGRSEVINDLDGEIANFWYVLGSEHQFKKFQKIVNLVPFSSERFLIAKNSTDDHAVEQAVNFFIRMRQSRQGLGKDFATLSRNRIRRGMNEQVASWLSAVEGLPEVHARLMRVVVLCRDALEVIKQQDGKNTLFYCDPPYVHSTRSSTGEYRFEMTDKQHKQLLNTLLSIKGAFMLSGYHSKLYDTWANINSIKCVEFRIDNKASSKNLKEKRIECVWKNF